MCVSTPDVARVSANSKEGATSSSTCIRVRACTLTRTHSSMTLRSRKRQQHKKEYSKKTLFNDYNGGTKSRTEMRESARPISSSVICV